MENYLSSYRFKPALRHFLKFLMREGIYFSFFRELEHRAKTDWLKQNILCRDACDEPTEAINYAFNWTSTEEGYFYWGEIDLKWRTKYKNIINDENA